MRGRKNNANLKTEIMPRDIRGFQQAVQRIKALENRVEKLEIENELGKDANIILLQRVEELEKTTNHLSRL